MHSRFVAALALLAFTASCRDRQGSGSPVADGPVASAKDVRGQSIRPERRAMGRWRSRSGLLPGSRNQWLVVDVAGTRDVRVEIRNRTSRLEAVSAFANGKAVVTDAGIEVTTSGQPGPLRDFSRFSATFPTTATMLLRTADGRTFDLAYDGV